MISPTVTVRVTGLNQIDAKLRKIPERTRGKIGKRALGKAALAIRRQARANALSVDDPDTGRKIAQNIGQRVRSKYNRQTGNIKISIGVLAESGRIPNSNPDTGPRGNTPHWHLVELGTDKMPAQPFLRRALSEKGDEAIAIFQREFMALIQKDPL